MQAPQDRRCWGALGRGQGGFFSLDCPAHCFVLMLGAQTELVSLSPRAGFWGHLSGTTEIAILFT